MQNASVKGTVISLFLFAALNSPALAQTTEWRYFTYFPINDKATQTTRAFAEDVAAATGGRLKIQVFAAGELPYKAPDVMKAVAGNQVQMGDVAVGFASGDVPELNVLSLPFMCTSFDQFDRAIAAIAPAVDETIRNKFKVKVAMNWTMPAQNLWFNRSVAAFADVKGLKVRTWNPEQVAMIRLLGGSPMSINSAEVIPALERRVIDGAITSALSANDWRAYDIVKFAFLPNFAMGHQVMLINEAELAKLPGDVRDTLLAKVAEWTPKYRTMSESGDREARANLAANGVKLVSPGPDDMAEARKAMRPMWDEWAGKHGAVGQGLLDKAAAACAAP